MVLAIIAVIAGFGVLAYLGGRFLDNSAAGINDAGADIREFGGDAGAAIFPGEEDPTCNQECRNRKGAAGNTFDFLFGEGSAAEVTPGVNNALTNFGNYLGSTFGPLFGLSDRSNAMTNPTRNTVRLSRSQGGQALRESGIFG